MKKNPSTTTPGRRPKGIPNGRLAKAGLTHNEYQRLVAKPLAKRDQEEEMKLAYVEGRQPFCVSCQRALKEMRQVHYVDFAWQWDEKSGEFKKYEDGQAETPHCAACGEGDWGYWDGKLVDF